MNFHQLECFVAVCNEGSFSKAAKKLYISESSISQTIRKIESELEVDLFNRSSRSLRLTYAGKQYLKVASTILQSQQNYINEIKGNSEDLSGELIILLSEKRAREFLPSVIPVLIAKYPNILYKIQDIRSPLETRLKMLLDGNCDFLVSNHIYSHNAVENVKICSEHLALIVAKGSPACHRLFPDGVIPPKISPEMFKEERLILQLPEYHGRQLIDAIFQDINSIPNVIMEVVSTETSKELAITGIACTLCDELVTGETPIQIEHDGYYSIPVDHPSAQKDIYISYNKMYKLSQVHIDLLNELVSKFNGGKFES